MRARMIATLALLVLLGSLAGSSASPDGLAAELRDLELRRVQLGKRFYLERDQLRAEAVEAEAAKARETERRTATDREARALEAELAELRTAEAALVASRDALAAAVAALERTTAKAEAGFAEDIRRGLPLRVQDRLDRLRTSPEEAAEPRAPVLRARRVLLAIDEEAALGATTEVVGDEAVLADGRRKRARFLRLGRIAAFFVTDDAAEAGVFVRGSQGEAAIDQDLRRAPLDRVLRAIEMADRRRPALPVALPVDMEAAR